MATIVVRRPHGMERAAVRSATTKLAEELKRSLSLHYQWNGDDLNFSGSGVNGAIRVREVDILVEVNLSWILRPLRGRIEQQINAYLDTHLT
jgi:putative polyhydroxyalkanoate system protein